MTARIASMVLESMHRLQSRTAVASRRSLEVPATAALRHSVSFFEDVPMIESLYSLRSRWSAWL